MSLKLLGVLLALSVTLSAGYVSRIGDDDGYGIGIPDGANHPFDGINANYDGRVPFEAAATNGAQFTDTYSAFYPGLGPDTVTSAKFIWTSIPMLTDAFLVVDMADFQAAEFGPLLVTFNGIVQDWAFQDGFRTTRIRAFQLSPAVIASINFLGTFTVTIDRNNSTDYVGFDYMELREGIVPEPGTWAMLGAGLVLLASRLRRR